MDITKNIPAPPQVTMGIKAINFAGFELSEYAKKLKEPVLFEAYEYQFNLTAVLNAENKYYELHLIITIFEKQSANTKIELAKLTMSVSFNILNFDEVILKGEDGIFSVPDAILTITSGASVASARGMLAIVASGTKLSNAIIPLVNPQMFIAKKPS